jgi:hypothetical protein
LVSLPDGVNFGFDAKFARSNVLALLADLQPELPAFEAHHHSAEFVPGDFLAMNDKKLRAAIGSLNQSDLVRVPNSRACACLDDDAAAMMDALARQPGSQTDPVSQHLNL